MIQLLRVYAALAEATGCVQRPYQKAYNLLHLQL